MLIFRRIRAVFILIFLIIILLNITSIFVPILGYSPIKNLLPLSNIGMFKDSVVSGYIYGESSVKGSGPLTGDMKIGDKKVSLRGYIEPNFKPNGEVDPYILVSVDGLYKLLSGTELSGDLKPVDALKKLYYLDKTALKLYGNDVTLVTIDGASFIKINSKSGSRFARLVIDKPNQISVYDLTRITSGDGNTSIVLGKPSDFTGLKEDYTLVFVSKAIKLIDSCTRDLIYPNTYGISTTLPYMELDRSIIDPLVSLNNVAKKMGYNLLLVSGYRSIEKQKQLHDSRIQEFLNDGYTQSEAIEKASQEVMPPGYSEHMTARAADIVTVEKSSLDGFVGSKEAKWIGENAHKFGFIVRYPSDKTSITHIIFEPWHLRYVGIPYSNYMKSNNLVFEEFFEKSQKGILISDSGKSVYLSAKPTNTPGSIYSDIGADFKRYIMTDKYWGYEIDLN